MVGYIYTVHVHTRELIQNKKNIYIDNKKKYSHKRQCTFAVVTSTPTIDSIISFIGNNINVRYAIRRWRTRTNAHASWPARGTGGDGSNTYLRCQRKRRRPLNKLNS